LFSGTGKTEAMVAGVVEFLRSHETVRVAIAVPTHKLGEGLADRINCACGPKVAAEWYGTEHSDPLAPDEKMCRLAEAAAELISLGARCSFSAAAATSRRNTVCTTDSRGVRGCGYQRQQTLEVRNRTRVWIIPATMLAAAPPSRPETCKAWW